MLLWQWQLQEVTENHLLLQFMQHIHHLHHNHPLLSLRLSQTNQFPLRILKRRVLILVNSLWKKELILLKLFSLNNSLKSQMANSKARLIFLNLSQSLDSKLTPYLQQDFMVSTSNSSQLLKIFTFMQIFLSALLLVTNSIFQSHYQIISSQQ